MAAFMDKPVEPRRRAGIRRAKKQNPKTDLTPMVDLGFLLITFFVITAELSKPAVTKLNMPKDGAPMPLGKSNALTVLLRGNNTLYYYEGEWKEALAAKQIFATSFDPRNGLGRLIREKQQGLDRAGTREGRDGLMLLIKAGDQASYTNLIDALDEAIIHDVKKYAVVKPSPEEINYPESKK